MRNNYQDEEHQIIIDVVQSLVEAIPCDEGSILLEQLKGRQFNAVVTRDYMDRFTDPNSFRDNYLFASIFKKYPSFPTGLDRKAQALRVFKEGEAQCEVKNYQLFSSESLGINPEILRMHQQFMVETLGHLTRPKIDSIMEKAYWGPGSNVGTKNLQTALSDKMRSNLTCTKELAPYAHSILNELPRCIKAGILSAHTGDVSPLRADVVIVDGAKLSFVPKNAKTDRTITVEPLFNSLLQNGIGVYMRQLLKRKGIADLDNQDRSIALAGKSLRYKLDTIDLKNASNTLSIALVKTSLAKCRGWFEMLDLVRSKRYTLDGELHGFRLFAGMGNGFTFPLESLIFYSLARAVCLYQKVEPVITIYGDDIISPSSATPLLIEEFCHAGLTVNVEKSFTGTHPFREACGGYFYSGYSVKPAFVSQSMTENSTLVSLHNTLWRWASQDGISFDTRVVGTLRLLRKRLKPFGYALVHPDLGDVGLFPLGDIGSGYMTHYKCAIPRVSHRWERGGQGYWASMSRALSRVSYGPEGIKPLDLVSGVSDDVSLYTRRLAPDAIVSRKFKRLLYLTYKFPYVKI